MRLITRTKKKCLSTDHLRPRPRFISHKSFSHIHFVEKKVITNKTNKSNHVRSHIFVNNLGKY